MILVLIFNTVSFNKPTESLAGVWDNAYTYYNKYSNNSVFKATSDTNGYIYCGTKGNLSSSSIKYRTIGWKMKITDLKGNSLQTLYFKLGGNYLVMNHQVQKDNYDYRLYSISLYALKRRMNDTALDNIKKGNCKIILDACMIVVKDGVAGGKMNDSGVTSGKVYTTYKGISGAQNWSSSAKSSLKLRQKRLPNTELTYFLRHFTTDAVILQTTQQTV